jgi:hypothetical protein
MIRHLVFWKLKETALEQAAHSNGAEMLLRLRALKNKIPQIIELDCGMDFNGSDKAWHLALNTVFETKADLQIYQNHPDHQAVVAFVQQVVSDRAVVDFEC